MLYSSTVTCDVLAQHGVCHSTPNYSYYCSGMIHDAMNALVQQNHHHHRGGNNPLGHFEWEWAPQKHQKTYTCIASRGLFPWWFYQTDLDNLHSSKGGKHFHCCGVDLAIIAFSRGGFGIGNARPSTNTYCLTENSIYEQCTAESWRGIEILVSGYQQTKKTKDDEFALEILYPLSTMMHHLLLQSETKIQELW